ncbi:MAG: helix-turn-helix transcriptional regulator [Actinomycetota bacterium]|nr:helix-turn-helix transcriptional regulator [Actinomycetota bacterium]
MEGDLQRAVGARLRSRRETLGLSQEAFAERLGVHRTYMGGIERGERNLTLRSVERIAGRLGVDPLALLADTEAPSPEAGVAGAGRARGARGPT